MIDPAPAPGPLAVEAALLLDVLAERLAAAQPGLRSPTPTAPPPAAGDPRTPGGEQPAGHPVGPACTTGCPFCQVLAVVRGERPETAARLVDGALLVVRSLRSLLDHADHRDHAADTGPAAGSPAPAGTTTRRPDRTDSSADQAASTGTGTAPQARVEWIDIR